ncbi:hypothetical protein DFJ74DRAFT_610378 [Hyaloraphidium curvatum]|nr:hypothetical protein DFJ74DRAFT_610378 [Hyaloraphidium curvatum]
MLSAALAARPTAAAAARSYATSASKDGYKVVVIGGGAAGVSVAAKLSNTPGFSGAKNVCIVEPSSTHYYQPLWTLVGAGVKPMTESARPESDVIPHSADWLQARVTKVDPVAKTVSTDGGKTVKYDVLVVAPGIQCDWDKVPGLVQTLGKDGVTSNYSAESAPRTWDFIKGFTGGNAIFTQPNTPIKCAGAPQKIAYLAEETWSKGGIRDKTKIAFNTGMGAIFSQPDYAKVLDGIAASKGISVSLNTNLVSIRPESKEAVFHRDGKEDVQKYDFLHVTPPMSAPKFIADSGLGNAQGFVDVDKYTLQHVKYPNVFSLGDGSSAPTSKTAAAVSGQAGVVYKNILSYMSEPAGVLYNKYDGYTACPITTSRDKLLLAEFSGYTMDTIETFEGMIDQKKEQGILYPLKTTVFPYLYWSRMLNGKWDGPRKIRNAIQVRRSRGPLSCFGSLLLLFQGVWVGDPVYPPGDSFFTPKAHHDHHW